MANRKNNTIPNKETCDSEDDHGTHQYRHTKSRSHWDFLFMWLKCLIVFLKFTFSFVFKLNQICKWQYSSSQSVFFLSIVDIHFWFLLDSIYRQISYSTKIMLNWMIVVLQQCFTVLQPILSFAEWTFYHSNNILLGLTKWLCFYISHWWFLPFSTIGGSRHLNVINSIRNEIL
jgi:hypothetical protein